MAWDAKLGRRFWTKVNHGDAMECWPWIARRNQSGYGTFKIADRSWLSHRVAWVLSVGPIQTGMLVCHRCDNPPCCNPRHLFLGTVADNQLDAGRKGRTFLQRHPEMAPARRIPGLKAGAKNGRAKITDLVIPEIRALRAQGLSQREIGERVGLCQQEISNILLGIRWAD